MASQGPPDAKRHKSAGGAGQTVLAAPLVAALRPEWFTGEATDPSIAALNDRIVEESAGTPELPEVGVEATRAAKAKAFVHGENFEDLQLPGLEGGSTVPARLFTPRSSVVLGALLHIHGGGFICGSAHGQNDSRLEALCESCCLAALSVDYRLAPEHTFPAASDDCLAAARWLATEGRRRLGCRTLLLVGESSGGNLAASLLLRLSGDEGGAKRTFDAVCLVYGLFDASLTPSAQNWGQRRLICNTREVEWFVQAYVGKHQDLRHPLLSPLHGDLRGLPPALFVVGTEDCLLDDSLFMHARWAAAGNEAALALFPGAAHGVGHFGPHKDTEQGKEARAAIEAFYRRHVFERTALLDNELCVLRSIPAGLEATGEQRTRASVAAEYWLALGAPGELSAAERQPGAQLPRSQRGVYLLRLLGVPRKPAGSAPADTLPGHGVDIGTRLLLSDQRVNIWEFWLRPGESCAYHRHRLPYLFTNLTASLTQALAEDGSAADCAPQYQRRCQTTFVDWDGIGAHGVKNVGDGDFLQLIVELKPEGGMR